MERSQSTDDGGIAEEEGQVRAPSGSQTLFRGLDVLDVVADGPMGLTELAQRLDLTRSTTHRLAAALVERHYLTFVPREGYNLGPKLLELGYRARQQMDIPRLARPHLERLAAQSEDTVHLGILDDGKALYLDKLPGRRRVSISSRVGERHPVASTGLGKALILDQGEAAWRSFFSRDGGRKTPEALERWLDKMRSYALQGHSFDLEENEDQIRCVAAPIRDATGRIVAAVSVSSASQYMGDDRMASLSQVVKDATRAISFDLGWNPEATPPSSSGSKRASQKQIA